MSAPSSSVHPPHPSPPSVLGAPVKVSSTPTSNNAAGSSNVVSAPLLAPASHSTTSRPRQSNSASASRSTATPPTTMTAATSSATGAQPRVTMESNPSLPSRTTQLHINEARAALVASMSNMLDSELQSRASLLHSNAAALAKQEKDVIKGTEALRKENDKLEKLARDTERKIKELGNVQNWAEVLERDFLILEETARLVRNGSGSDDSCSECSRSSWSGSYSGDDSRAGSRRGSVTGDADVNGKKPGEPGLNGNTATESGSRSGAFARRGDVNVTVDREVAASISEAMATALHESLDTLSLDPVLSDTHEGPVKGKEPVAEDSRTEVEISSGVPEARPSETSLSSSKTVSGNREEDGVTDRNSNASTIY
ncbi:uncharacterized protein F4812DRAFT_170912 [Daldinia caldariorum]|uniref:uncharacterized protein n=1 Tax=Daldinia caldariorum TaxID=326644 RepID=UPI0020077636|nr:uncharacterized protein F4812DRAFT_170912 [Daldinia caldariorum]KAI1471228.1 hypothetical protein F4812DRAFT_170912 [Daldinia caldariorum]